MFILDNSGEKNILNKCAHFNIISGNPTLLFPSKVHHTFMFWFHAFGLAPNTLGNIGKYIRTNQVIEKREHLRKQCTRWNSFPVSHSSMAVLNAVGQLGPQLSTVHLFLFLTRGLHSYYIINRKQPWKT